MSIDEKEVKDAVIGALKADATLAGYVKSFIAEGDGGAVKLFPFVSVGNVSRNITPRTIGRGGIDDYTFSFEIRFGTRNLTPGLAYDGDHGILQLSEDIENVVWPNNFGVFDDPAWALDVDTSFSDDSGGTLWIGTIRLEGTKGVPRPV